MREILFRGRLTNKSRWVYGCLINNIYGAVPAIMTEQSVDDAFNLDFEYDHVEEKTVGQFTGLTDKNGRKIFEGDVVRDEYNGGIARIAFLQQGCGWYLVFKNTDRRMGHRSRNSAYDNDLELEVIGNIHDNPELLEVSEDG